ncbi:TerB family tellurite resistance protein, partial [Escherichia coli]|uniref:TerB family tellurite resistance protein n=1 Tax=Escherichia coli TaxID=562 RepID=UPI001483C91A
RHSFPLSICRQARIGYREGFKTARRGALREIEDVKHDTREAEDVLDVAVAIAEADGEIEPEERKVLEEIAGVLGLRLENHL